MNFVLLQSEIISYINTPYNKNKYCELGKEERGANTKPIKGKFTTKVLYRVCPHYNTGAKGQKLKSEGAAGRNLTLTQ